MKTNRELNQAHEQRELARVRPKSKEYQFEALEKVVNQWIRDSLHREQT